MSAIKRWLGKATSDEKKRLASGARTSVAHLGHLASGFRTAGPELAARIEMAAARIRAKNQSLPVIKRTELCPACGACEFARRCAA